MSFHEGEPPPRETGELNPAPTFTDWLREHQEELRTHAGKYVAIDPVQGIVAVGLTCEEAERISDEKSMPDTLIVRAEHPGDSFAFASAA